VEVDEDWLHDPLLGDVEVPDEDLNLDDEEDEEEADDGWVTALNDELALGEVEILTEEDLDDESETEAEDDLDWTDTLLVEEQSPEPHPEDETLEED